MDVLSEAIVVTTVNCADKSDPQSAAFGKCLLGQPVNFTQFLQPGGQMFLRFGNNPQRFIFFPVLLHPTNGSIVGRQSRFNIRKF